MKKKKSTYPRQMDFKTFFLIGTALVFSFCAYHRALKIDENTQTYKDYQQGFIALIEKQISENKHAARPVVKIREMFETENELRIKYDYSFSEHYADGEEVMRHSSGEALLIKNSSGTHWVLRKVADLHEKLNFKKGVRVGTT